MALFQGVEWEGEVGIEGWPNFRRWSGGWGRNGGINRQDLEIKISCMH